MSSTVEPVARRRRKRRKHSSRWSRLFRFKTRVGRGAVIFTFVLVLALVLAVITFEIAQALLGPVERCLDCPPPPEGVP